MPDLNETGLEHSRLGAAYRGRLSQGLELLLSWLSVSGPAVLEALRAGRTCIQKIDQSLSKFVNSCFEEKFIVLAC